MIIQSVSAQEFKQEMENEDVIVFDVRAPEEHIHF
jgi:rhodanese-related sulfurtransferase